MEQEKQEQQEKKEKKSKFGWILIALCLLIACIAATTIMWMDRMNPYLMSSAGAIELNLGEILSKEKINELKDKLDDETGDGTEEGNGEETGEGQTGQKEKKAGFEVSDESSVWATTTEFQIFSIDYENGEEVVTVQSSEKDKVIAPGTEQTYVFKVKNTGEVVLDYAVDVQVHITPDETILPVESRLYRYDGTYIAGDMDEYIDVAELDGSYDSGVLGAGKYGYYVLEWVWPFESGDDAYDTLLGNQTIEEEITLTLQINTYATVSENQNQDGGIMAPDTGDDANMPLILAVSAGAVVLLFLLLILKMKNDERIAPEAKK